MILVSLILKTGERLPRFATLSETMRSFAALLLTVPCTIADYVQNIVVTRILYDPPSAVAESISLASALIVTKLSLLEVPVVVIAAFALGAAEFVRRTEIQASAIWTGQLKTYRKLPALVIVRRGRLNEFEIVRKHGT